MLYMGVRRTLMDYLDKMVDAVLVDKFVTFNQEQRVEMEHQLVTFVKTMEHAWKEHATALAMVRDILMYLDRAYVKTANVAHIYDLGLDLYRDRVLNCALHPVSSQLYQSLMELITLERGGHVVDASSFRGIVEMLQSLQTTPGRWSVYEMEFEAKFLETSQHFYHQEANELLSRPGITATLYLNHVQKRLSEEVDRCQRYLPRSTLGKITRVIEEWMLGKHLVQLVEMPTSGLVAMSDAKQLDDAHLMYKLMRTIEGGHAQMQQTLFSHILELGKGVNTSSKQGTQEEGGSASMWVLGVVALKAHFDTILKDAFEGDRKFQMRFNDAFEAFVNAHKRAPEYISLFLDEHLKKHFKGKSEEDVEQVLDQAVTLFRFIKDKDMFERFYKQHLAKRLLSGRSTSDDAERSMISKLKLECGYQFTSRLEGMFNDMRISSELMSEYRALVKESNLKALELNATVLTSTYWPLSSLMQVSRVPEELSVACDLYQKYYLERHNGRRLTWHCNIGTADVRAFWGNKRYELTMSTFCMFVLLAFNQPQSAVLSFGDLQRITDIPENELKRTLQSLACAKYKILLKHPKGKEIDATADTFQVNTEFACANSKIRIQQIAASSKNGSLGRDQYDQDERESKAIRERVQEDRKPACDAAIIRIMKARKTLSHNELVVQVTQVLQSHFSVDPIVLKSRIEALIDRDYLKRTDDRKVYEYVA